MKVARQELPGIAERWIRPVGNGMIGLTTPESYFGERSPAFFPRRRFTFKPWVPTSHTVPYGTDLFLARAQAVPAWLPSLVPTGQESLGSKVNAYGFQPWVSCREEMRPESGAKRIVQGDGALNSPATLSGATFRARVANELTQGSSAWATIYSRSAAKSDKHTGF